MGWALLNYNIASSGVGTTNDDLTAATDPDFSQRNGHYIFTEQYYLAGAMVLGATVSNARLFVPTWNAIGTFDVFNMNRSLNPPSNTQVDWWLPYMPPVPQMEEFQFQISNNGPGAQIENGTIWLASEDWTANLPRGRLPILVRATSTISGTINTWSGPNAISLIQTLRGGVYAVCGGVVVGTNANVFRLIFPRYRLYHGRKLRPGGPVLNAIGNVFDNNQIPWIFNMGEWGRFHTFELPQVEVFLTAAAGATYTLYMWLVYLGEDLSQLSQGLGGGI